ncbi:MAG: hypothetical protein ACREID_09970 [Planctomycetota bacterium]
MDDHGSRADLDESDFGIPPIPPGKPAASRRWIPVLSRTAALAIIGFLLAKWRVSSSADEVAACRELSREELLQRLEQENDLPFAAAFVALTVALGLVYAVVTGVAWALEKAITRAGSSASRE